MPLANQHIDKVRQAFQAFPESNLTDLKSHSIYTKKCPITLNAKRREKEKEKQYSAGR